MRTKVNATSSRLDSTLTTNDRSTFTQFQALFSTTSPTLVRARIKVLGLKVAITSKKVTGPLAH